MIVTPYLQDVEMGSTRTVRTFVEQQAKAGTAIELFTTPPTIKNSAEFHRKFQLLETFALLGVRIVLNDKLHAKAFCFNNGDVMMVTVLGSANLTTGGFYDHLELAVHSGKDAVYHSVMAHVRIYIRDSQTSEFAVWKAKNALQLNALRKGTP
jgi:HKD family nuclease